MAFANFTAVLNAVCSFGEATVVIGAALRVLLVVGVLLLIRDFFSIAIVNSSLVLFDNCQRP